MYAISRQHAGFTLIELLITMAIIAILLSIGIPAYNSTTTSTRMSGEIYAFMNDVKFARSEATKRGQAVYICSTSDNINCDLSGSQWSAGRLVYVDSTNSGLIQTPTAAQVLRISAGVTHNDTMTAGADVQILQSGYEFMTGTATLHDAADDINQRRCITVVSGSAVINTGANCP